MSLQQLNFSIFVVAQSVILKSVFFKNLMQASTMCFFSISQIFVFQNYIWAVDQKHIGNNQLEWPNGTLKFI